MTDKQAEETPTLQESEDREQLLADAGRVYRYVTRNKLIEEDDLRRYGERNDLSPDRLNAAINFLSETDQLILVPSDARFEAILPTPTAEMIVVDPTNLPNSEETR